MHASGIGRMMIIFKSNLHQIHHKMNPSIARISRNSAGLKCLKRGLASVASTIPSTSSGSTSTKQWKPPIEAGIEPAYDEAIKFINQQSARHKDQLALLKLEIERSEPNSVERSLAEARYHATSIASKINNPEIRWRFQNDPNVSLEDPVFAHLREKVWRENELTKLMERSRLMKVVPDAVPTITPMVDVQVSFGNGTGIHDHGGEAGEVTVGCFVDVNKSMDQPLIEITPFHAEQRLYTLALIDLDAPEAENDRLSSFALWLVQNVSLSLSKTKVDANSDQIVLPYIPPHPQRGTKYHRYALIALEQESKDQQITLSNELTRNGFSLRELIKEHSLSPAGLHFWRGKWTTESKATVSQIYKDILKKPEPRFDSELVA